MTDYNIRDNIIKENKGIFLEDATYRPTKQEAQDAVRTLIAWIGDDPTREGLMRTPERVIKAYEDFFAGYHQDPKELFQRTFEDVGGYDDIVLLRNIEVQSHCEHHMVPFHGCAHIAYLPNKKILGLSKIARLVDIYARRLQTQETLTQQIANMLNHHLEPKGCAVMIIAEHECMTKRGVQKKSSETITCALTGLFREDKDVETRFLDMIKK